MATTLAPFRVSYHPYCAEAGDHEMPLGQGLCRDFACEDKATAEPNQIFMAWPEFIAITDEKLPEGAPMPNRG